MNEEWYRLTIEELKRENASLREKLNHIDSEARNLEREVNRAHAMATTAEWTPRQARTNAGLSQAQCATIIGVSPRSYWLREHYRYPWTQEQKLLLSSAWGVSPCAIIWGGTTHD